MFDLPKNNSAKIVKQALSFLKPDRLPVCDGFWGGFVENWRKERNQPENADIEDYYWIDLKVLVALEQFFPSQMGEIKKEGKDVYSNDGWGRVIRTKPGTYFSEPVERVFNKPADLDKIEFEPSDLDIRYEGFIKEVSRQRHKGRAVFVKIGGPFIRSSYFRGETDFLMDMAEDEGFTRAQVEKVGAHLLEIGLESLRRAEAYDFGLWIYDDMCNINGPMFSPKTFERVFKPTYKKMISAFKEAGARWVILHCDGNLLPLLEMLIECGIDGLNPVEYGAGLDIVKLMKKYGKRLSYIGGVCNTHILPGGDEKRIRGHVAAIIEAGRNGGLVIGSHSIGPDVSIENYELYRKTIMAKHS